MPTQVQYTYTNTIYPHITKYLHKYDTPVKYNTPTQIQYTYTNTIYPYKYNISTQYNIPTQIQYNTIYPYKHNVIFPHKYNIPTNTHTHTFQNTFTLLHLFTHNTSLHVTSLIHTLLYKKQLALRPDTHWCTTFLAQLETTLIPCQALSTFLSFSHC
jgi:hypothetical protein